MKRLSVIGTLTILSIALFFMLSWGFDAWLSLSSATFGLDDVWRSQTVFGVGRYLGLGPDGLLRLAAIFAAIKLTVAGVCGLHLLARIRGFFGGQPDTEILEAGLMLAVSLSVIGVLPALLHSNHDVAREHLIDISFAGIAIALCIIARTRSETVVVPKTLDDTLAKTVRRFHA